MSIAILAELSGTLSAKLAAGMTNIPYTLSMLMSYFVSVSFLSLALDTANNENGLDLGVAYASWSGLGTVVAALAGALLFGESLAASQIVGVVLTIVGVTLVNITFNKDEDSSTAATEHKQEPEVSETTPLLFGQS